MDATSDTIFSIKNVPVGCIILSILAIVGYFSHPDPIWFVIFGVTFLAGVAGFIVEKMLRKYEADKLVESEKIRLRREKERTKQKERAHTQRLDAESIKTQRENIRKQKLEIKKDTTVTDNLFKLFRGR